MPFGLEDMHRQHDIVITATTVNFIIIQPQAKLSPEITDEILEINTLPGWEVGWEAGSYYLRSPESCDSFAFAERIAIGLEEKGMKVKRISETLANNFSPVPCQSFVLA